MLKNKMLNKEVNNEKVEQEMSKRIIRKKTIKTRERLIVRNWRNTLLLQCC